MSAKRMRFERRWSRYEQRITASQDRWFEWCCKHCYCDVDFGVCDSVMAGAPCERRQREWDDECDEYGQQHEQY